MSADAAAHLLTFDLPLELTSRLDALAGGHPGALVAAVRVALGVGCERVWRDRSGGFEEGEAGTRAGRR